MTIQEISRQAAPRCATCEHFKRGSNDPECFEPTLIAAGNNGSLLVEPDFGCYLHSAGHPADAVTLAVLKEVKDRLRSKINGFACYCQAERVLDALLASLVIPTQVEKLTFQRCEGRYPVPHKRDEAFDVTYRCGRQHGHLGACGASDASLVIPQEVNTSAERASETAKSEHVDQPNGSVDGFGVQKG